MSVEIQFVLTRPTLVDIMSGVLLFESAQEYNLWIENNWEKFRICTTVKNRTLTLINLK